MVDIVIRGGGMTIYESPEGDLSVKEAAKLLSVHPNTIKNLIKRGEFKSVYRIGGQNLRIPRTEIQAYKERQRITKE